MSTRDTLCEVQQPGCDGDQSAPSSTEVMDYSYNYHSPLCLHDVYRDNLTLFLDSLLVLRHKLLAIILCDIHVLSTACDSEAFNSRETLEKRKPHSLRDQNEYETDKPAHMLS